MILLVFCCHYKSPREMRIMIFSWLFLKVPKCHLGLWHSDSIITSHKIPYVNGILPMLGCNSLVPRYPTILIQKVETKMVRQSWYVWTSHMHTRNLIPFQLCNWRTWFFYQTKKNSLATSPAGLADRVDFWFVTFLILSHYTQTILLYPLTSLLFMYKLYLLIPMQMYREFIFSKTCFL